MLLLGRNALNGDLQTNYVESRNATGPSEQWAACLSVCQANLPKVMILK